MGEAATALAEQFGIQCLLQWNADRDSAISGFSEPGVVAPCLIPWRFLFIQEHTREVFACPYHRYPHGDLTTASLGAIWNSDTAQDMRRSLARGDIPKYCLDHSASCPLIMEARHQGIQGSIENCIIMGENDFTHLVAGWYPLEYVPQPIRWTSKASDFLIRIAGQKWLFVEVAVWREYAAKEPICGMIELAGYVLGWFRLMNDGWNVLSFPLPQTIATPVVQGRIVMEQTWVPAKVGLGRDTRQLGIAVRRIWAAQSL